MKPPPLLVGAALLFWGWQTDFLIAGAIMAAVLESARFAETRWELSNDDFSRIWTFCAVLFLATGAYAFTSNNGPANVSRLLAGGRGSVQALSGVSKTSVLLIRWLPMVFFLFIAAQAFSNREGIPLETISLILRRRWKLARKAGLPLPESRVVNVAYPYFITCIFAASSHSATDNNSFFWGLCGLLAWVLWTGRSRRFGWLVWAGAMALAILTGYEGQRSLVLLKQKVDQYSPQWLAGLVRAGVSPFESRTEIGQVGRIKTSGQIVIRLKTQNESPPPSYLREASYRTYSSAVWFGSRSKDDFSNVPERPPNSGSGNWPLLDAKTNAASLNIACYLPGGDALLPLPTGAGQLEQLPAYIVKKNSMGAVRAQGPGLVIFNADYGPGLVIDAAPDANDDVAVPGTEKPALDNVISELQLKGQDREKVLEAISRYFETKFTYSLWQERPSVKENNLTALARFLTKSRSGHCEYFATATVLLLRQLGIPARYTVGYFVHEASGAKDYVVRQNDAHAWCRVWNDRSHNWEDFDTTPGSWLEAERHQRSAFQFLFDGWSRMVFEFSKFRWGQSNLRQIILWTLVPVLTLLLYQIIFRGNRRRALQNPKAIVKNILWPGLDSEFYQLESALARNGLTRHSSEPLSVWLGRTATELGYSKLTQPLRQILSLHYRYRFDPQGLNDQDREELRREVAVCLSQIALKK